MPHLVPAVLVLAGVKYCRGYSVVPNISFKFENIQDRASIQKYEGALQGEQVVNQNVASKDTSFSFQLPLVSRFNASYASALYQDGLSEIRVNALFGLNLIRAY